MITFHVYYEDHGSDTERYFLDGLKTAVEMASEYGIVLGFETMETSFMDTTMKSMKYVDRINSPYLGVYPDIGNLKNSSLIYGTDKTAKTINNTIIKTFLVLFFFLLPIELLLTKPDATHT